MGHDPVFFITLLFLVVVLVVPFLNKGLGPTCDYGTILANLTPEELFGGKVLRLAPDTYFLTPTGRVDVVERQAAVSL